MAPENQAALLIVDFLQVIKGPLPEAAITAKRCALIAAAKIKNQLTTNLSNELSGTHAIYWDKVEQSIKNFNIC